MRSHVAIAATAILILAALSVAGPGLATYDDQSYEQGQDAEHEPNCRGADSDGDGEPDRQATGPTVDPKEVDNLLGTDHFEDFDKIPVPIDVTVGEDQFVTFCQGEQWDAEDPNTKESDRNSEAQGDADEPLVDAENGTVYVNPLWDGDCSGWDSEEHEDGCEGGTQKPALTEPVHARATADAPAGPDDDKRVSVYVNTEVWGVIRAANAVGVDHDDREGWTFLYGEDHTDQLVVAAGGPFITENGNLLCIPFGLVQGGECEEGDCTSHEYQHASNNKQHDDGEDPHSHSCPRDNTVLAGLQLGYAWLPLPEASQEDLGTSTSPILP